MSELIIPRDSNQVLRERRSVLASFAMGLTRRVRTDGFRQDLADAIFYMTDDPAHFASGEVVTKANRQAIASSSVLAQIAASWKKEQPVILSPDVPRALSVYQETQTVIDNVGLTLAESELDMPTVLATAQRLNGKDVPSTPLIETAVAVLSARGTVMIKMESSDDICSATGTLDTSTQAPDVYYEDGKNRIRAETYSLSDLRVPSSMQEVSYYGQFFEIEQGSQWLGSLLADIQTIHTRMQNVA